MRQLGALLTGAAALVVAAGCAGQGTASSGGGGGPAASSSAPTSSSAPASVVTGPAMPGVHLPPGAVPVPGSRVDARSLPASFPREVWTEQGGTVLGLYGQQGDCFTSSATVASQGAQEVVVRLVQQEPGTGAQVCPLYLRYKPMSVPLGTPLGQRTVVLQLAIVRG